MLMGGKVKINTYRRGGEEGMLCAKKKGPVKKYFNGGIRKGCRKDNCRTGK